MLGLGKLINHLRPHLDIESNESIGAMPPSKSAWHPQLHCIGFMSGAVAEIPNFRYSNNAQLMHCPVHYQSLNRAGMCEPASRLPFPTFLLDRVEEDESCISAVWGIPPGFRVLADCSCLSNL